MLEQFLEQVKEVEAKYCEEETTDLYLGGRSGVISKEPAHTRGEGWPQDRQAHALKLLFPQGWQAPGG
jgi:hypothetical protein